MSLPTKSYVATCADEIVDMLNDQRRSWKGKFKAERKYIVPTFSSDELKTLRCVVTIDAHERETYNRQNLTKKYAVQITFRKKLDNSLSVEAFDDLVITELELSDTDPEVVELDALTAIVETVADYFSADTENNGVRELPTNNAFVAGVVVAPIFSPEDLEKGEFLSVVTLTVAGVEGVVHEEDQ